MRSFDRQAVEARADAFVREHRFTIAVVFPVVGLVLLVASREGLLPGVLTFNPALILFGTLVMRLPLLVGLLPTVDRRAAVGLLVLAGFTYAVELVGLATGLPYGEFTYLVSLGPMLPGGVPLGLPVFFLPLVLNAYLLVLLLSGRTAGRRPVRLGAALAGVLAIDLVLDPAAVAIGFWAYADGGAYYGVPASNYAGWLLSGGVAVALVDRSFRRPTLTRRLARCEFVLDDLVSFLILWGGVNAYYGNWVPVVLAVAGFAGLLRADRVDVAVFRPWTPLPRR